MGCLFEARLFEVDPIACPRCLAPMTAITIILDDAELDRLLPHIGVEADFPKTKHALGEADCPPDFNAG